MLLKQGYLKICFSEAMFCVSLAHEHFEEIYLKFIAFFFKAILISSAPVMAKTLVLQQATVSGMGMGHS